MRPENSVLRPGLGKFWRMSPPSVRAKTTDCKSSSSRLAVTTKTVLLPLPIGPIRLPSYMRRCSGGRVSANGSRAFSLYLKHLDAVGGQRSEAGFGEGLEE